MKVPNSGWTLWNSGEPSDCDHHGKYLDEDINIYYPTSDSEMLPSTTVPQVQEDQVKDEWVSFFNDNELA